MDLTLGRFGIINVACLYNATPAHPPILTCEVTLLFKLR